VQDAFMSGKVLPIKGFGLDVLGARSPVKPTWAEGVIVKRQLNPGILILSKYLFHYQQIKL
jgi:hypothetical protein